MGQDEHGTGSGGRAQFVQLSLRNWVCHDNNLIVLWMISAVKR
jgi:hypothetical protein